MKRNHSLSLLFAFLVPGAPAAAQCNSGSTPTGVDYPIPVGTVCRAATPGGDPGNFYDVNPVANDYATFYFDAKQPACAALARSRFEEKLRNNLNYANSGGKICDPRRDTAGTLPTTDPFQPALAGAVITGIYATAVALLDSGADWCVAPPELRDALGLDGTPDPSTPPLLSRFGTIHGRLERLSVRFLADEGEPLEVETTWFISADWNGPAVLGWKGCLERMRYTSDPREGRNAFYFAGLEEREAL